MRACWIEKIERMDGGLTSVMEGRRSRELKQQPAEVITQLVPLSGATEQARGCPVPQNIGQISGLSTLISDS